MDRLTQFTRPGLRFAVTDEGPLDGPPVLLLHGFPQDASSFDAVAPLLHERGLRTLRFDQRGYAPGARPRGVAAYRRRHLVADVLALIDAARLPQVHLAGHDWGGFVTWFTALAAPRSVATATVLATPHPTAFSEALRTPGQLRKSWYVGAFQLPAVPERLLAGHVDRMLTSTGVPAELAARYGRRFTRAADLTGPINWYRAALRYDGIAGELTGDAAQVRVPTTYVWGNRDMALGRLAAERTQRYVAAPYRFVELDATHWLPELNADAVAAAITARVLGEE